MRSTESLTLYSVFDERLRAPIDYQTNWYERDKPNYKEFDEGIPDFWLMKYNDRWQLASDLLNMSPFTYKKVLDIGCGMGRALTHFKRLGADVLGVEPSVYASGIAKSRGLPVINDYFENTNIQDKFDVIHVEQVLSHIPNWEATIIKAKELLKDRGVMIIEEPNDNNILQRILEADHGKYWVTPDHCNYFHIDSFPKDLQRLGLTTVCKSCTYPMELFQLQGENYIGNEAVGGQVHAKRFELESKLPFTLRQRLHESFASLGIGRDIVLFLKKGVSDE